MKANIIIFSAGIAVTVSFFLSDTNNEYLVCVLFGFSAIGIGFVIKLIAQGMPR